VEALILSRVDGPALEWLGFDVSPPYWDMIQLGHVLGLRRVRGHLGDG
jgi:hypothetical protein